MTQEQQVKDLNTLPFNAFRITDKTRSDDLHNQIFEKLDQEDGVTHNRVVEVTLPLGMSFEIYFVAGYRHDCGALYITHNRHIAVQIAETLDKSRIEAYEYDPLTMLGINKEG